MNATFALVTGAQKPSRVVLATVILFTWKFQRKLLSRALTICALNAQKN